jgi:manganese/zinc/iron transport system permease protein
MFANSLSHTILFGIVVSFLIFGGSSLFDLSHLCLGALIAAILTAVLTEGLVKWFRLSEDASVGLIFTFLFALGVVFATVFLRDVHLGVESVMGNADLLQISDLKNAFFLAFFSGAVVMGFYRQFQIGSFDGSLAKVLGLPSSFFQFLLLFLVSATCTGAFRAVGVLLVLSFLVGPYLTARLFCHHLKRLIVYSCLIGVAASFCGVALSRHLLSEFDIALSTGGIVVGFIGLFYFVGLSAKMWYPRVRKYLHD